METIRILAAPEDRLPAESNRSSKQSSKNDNGCALSGSFTPETPTNEENDVKTISFVDLASG